MFEGSKKAAPLVTRLIAVAAVPVLSLLALSLTPHPTDSDASAAYVEPAEPAAGDVTVLASEVFLTNASAQLLSRESGDLELAAGQSVTVDYQDSLVSAVSQEETVAELLARLEIQPSPLEMVSVSSQEDGVTITIDSELVFYENVSSVEEHEVIYQYNSQKPDWYESVIQEGSNGEYTEVYEVIYQDGAETSRHLVDVVDSDPVPTIIEKGTIANFANNGDKVTNISANADGSGTLTLENGEVLTYREARTMRGTAYTAGEGKVDTVTATGTTVRPGVVAVDRNTLPLGTKVYVVSNDGAYTYGFAIAEDTGVRGNIIDLYMNSYDECIQFGVRDCTVYILD